MTEQINTDFAWNLGVEYATQFNHGKPIDRIGLRPFTKNDNIPDGDYMELRRHYGDVSREIETAYKDGFNCTAMFDEDKEYTDSSENF